MSRTADAVLSKVVSLVRQGKGREAIQEATGLSMWKTRQLMAQARVILRSGGSGKTVPLKSEEQIKLDQQIARLRDERTEVEAKYKALLRELDRKESTLAEILSLSNAVKSCDPRKLRVVDSGKPSQSTAFMIGSDWHLEERVDPATVGGINETSLAITSKRVASFFRNGLKLVDMGRSKSRIDTLILALLGDLMSGYIHEELMETNSLSPVQAALRVFELAVAGIDLLVEHGGFKRIIVPCCYGNHGRTTQKPRVSTGAHNSYEWLIYQFLAARYQNHPTVAVQVAEGYFNFVEVYGRLIRFHHGDGIRYQGGVGGIGIPLNKAIAQWNKMKGKSADLDVLGHWHNRMSSGNYVVNGSVVGFNAYSIKIKADYQEPCQSFFLIHPRYGKTVEAPILTEENVT